MGASRKKRAKPRKNIKVKANKSTAVPSGLKALDAEWRSFIEHAAEDKPLTEAWPDPKGAAVRPRAAAATTKAAKKKSPAARKKATKKKAPAKARKKQAARK